jgi:hypothetical protein
MSLMVKAPILMNQSHLVKLSGFGNGRDLSFEATVTFAP